MPAKMIDMDGTLGDGPSAISLSPPSKAPALPQITEGPEPEPVMTKIVTQKQNFFPDDDGQPLHFDRKVKDLESHYNKLYEQNAEVRKENETFRAHLETRQREMDEREKLLGSPSGSRNVREIAGKPSALQLPQVPAITSEQWTEMSETERLIAQRQYAIEQQNTLLFQQQQNMEQAVFTSVGEQLLSQEYQTVRSTLAPAFMAVGVDVPSRVELENIAEANGFGETESKPLVAAALLYLEVKGSSPGRKEGSKPDEPPTTPLIAKPGGIPRFQPGASGEEVSGPRLYQSKDGRTDWGASREAARRSIGLP